MKVQNLELPKLFYVKPIYNVMKVNHITIWDEQNYFFIKLT